jgi:7-cyano-7-deazaguanine synthase
MRPGHALVLFSGGQDSATCLAWALTQFERVETIGFDYGQRHHVELQARQTVLAQMRERFAPWRGRLGEDHMVDLAVLGRISDTALTSDAEIQMTAAGLPNTFVPGRNLLFFNLAAAVGYRRGLHTLVGGMCETDFSGYPDCRDDTLKALQVAVSLGMGQRFTFETPLMWLDKADTWELARWWISSSPNRTPATTACAARCMTGATAAAPARRANCARRAMRGGRPASQASPATEARTGRISMHNPMHLLHGFSPSLTDKRSADS